MAFEVHSVSRGLDASLADASLVYLFKAPSAANGGGLTIVGADAITTQTDQGAGTAFALQLLKYSSAGTPAVNGTISTALIGGTANPLANGVPQAWTLSSTDCKVSAGEWVVVKYTEQGAATNPANCTVTVRYLMGK